MLKEGKRTDPRTLRTRRALQDSFKALMGEKGFHDITVGDVAERAGVNRATFYAHYEDKYDLLEDTIRAMFGQTLQWRLPEKASLSEENVQSLILAVCDFVRQIQGSCTPSKREFEPLVEREVKAQVYEVLLGWLRERHHAQSRGHDRAGSGSSSGSRGAPLELVASIGSWSIYGAAARWASESHPGSEEEFVRQVLPMIMAGLSYAS